MHSPDSTFSSSLPVVIGPINVQENFTIEDDASPNPGIGGTEFQTVIMAIALAKEGYKVDLICSPGSVVSPLIRSIDPTEAIRGEYGVQISPFSSLGHSVTQSLTAAKRVAVSHHPHDLSHSRKIDIRTWDLLVSVGQYQFWSNLSSPIPHIWIPGFARPRTEEMRLATGQGFLMGHISSLHPSKGFHIVAKAWKKITRAIPAARLEVIGGLRLYGEASGEMDPEIPTSTKYANKIRRAFGGSIPPTVKFLGVTSGERIASLSKSWDLALLNPIGTGEADPGVVRDCWRTGVPVVASNRYGMGDYMVHFPELIANNPREIARIVKRLHHRPEFLEELQLRTRQQFSQVWNRTQEAKRAWSTVVSQLLGEASGASLEKLGLIPRERNSVDRALLIRGLMATNAIHAAGRIRLLIGHRR